MISRAEAVDAPISAQTKGRQWPNYDPTPEQSSARALGKFSAPQGLLVAGKEVQLEPTLSRRWTWDDDDIQCTQNQGVDQQAVFLTLICVGGVWGYRTAIIIFWSVHGSSSLFCVRCYSRSLICGLLQYKLVNNISSSKMFLPSFFVVRTMQRGVVCIGIAPWLPLPIMFTFSYIST